MSATIEDMGVDLYVMERAILSTHPTLTTFVSGGRRAPSCLGRPFVCVCCVVFVCALIPAAAAAAARRRSLKKFWRPTRGW